VISIAYSLTVPWYIECLYCWKKGPSRRPEAARLRRPRPPGLAGVRDALLPAVAARSRAAAALLPPRLRRAPVPRPRTYLPPGAHSPPLSPPTAGSAWPHAAACRPPARSSSALVLAAAPAFSACDVKPGDGIGVERALVFPTVVGVILAGSILSVVVVVERDGEF
jgi:hypothetical protein